MATHYSDDSFTFPAGRGDESYIMHGSPNPGKSYENGHESFYTANGHEQSRGSSPRRKIMLDVLIRLLTCISCTAGLIVMVLDKQTITGLLPVNGVPTAVEIHAKWHYASAYIWFVIATGLVAVYALISAALSLISTSKKPGSRPSFLTWAIFIFDLVMVNTLMSALGAGIAVGLLGKYGNTHTNWLKFCNNFGRFCDHVTGALVAGGAGFLFLIQLCVLDAYHIYILGRRNTPSLP